MGALGLVDQGAQRVDQYLDAVVAGAGPGRIGPGGIPLFGRPAWRPGDARNDRDYQGGKTDPPCRR